MNGTLRLATGLFATVPTQKWVTVLCLVIAAPVLFWQNRGTGLLALVALAILVLTQSMIVGVAIRHIASSRAFRLRPRGAAVLWLAATAALVATAAACTVVVLIAMAATPSAAAVSPLVALATAIGLLMAAWTVAFVVSGHPLGFVLLATAFTLLPRWKPALPGLAGLPLVPLAAAAGAIAWAWLGLRLASGRPVRAGWRMAPSADPADAPLWRWMVERARGPSGPPGRGIAVRTWLLGTPSLAPATAIGLVPGLILAGMLVLDDKSRSPAGLTNTVLTMLGVVFVVSAPYAYSTMTRARTIWLRTGLDRQAMYRQVERAAFTLVAVAAVAAALPLIAVVAWRGGGVPDARLAFVLATNLCVTACLVWYQLLLVRGWSALSVIGVVVLALAWLVTLATSAMDGPTSNVVRVAVISVIAALAAMFRTIGPRRWRTIDWMRLKMPRAAPRRG